MRGRTGRWRPGSAASTWRFALWCAGPGAGVTGLDGLRDCGKLLADHVRFEERELFPLIEGGLDPAALAALGREIIAAEERGVGGAEG